MIEPEKMDKSGLTCEMCFEQTVCYPLCIKDATKKYKEYFLCSKCCNKIQKIIRGGYHD